MYELLKRLVLPLLRCPSEPPEAPVGSHASVQVFRASPAHWKYRLVQVYLNMIGAFVGEFILFIFLISSGNAVSLSFAVLMIFLVVTKVLFTYVVTRLDYEMRYYIITDRSLRIREGVMVIREITLTFENIQNLKINQGPLQRMFGIYDLVVETAGGGAVNQAQEQQLSSFMHRGVFRGIKRPQELRDLILSYLKQVRSSGLGDHDDEGAMVPTTSPKSDLAFSPEMLQVLRAMREETTAMRRAVDA